MVYPEHNSQSPTPLCFPQKREKKAFTAYQEATASLGLDHTNKQQSSNQLCPAVMLCLAHTHHQTRRAASVTVLLTVS